MVQQISTLGAFDALHNSRPAQAGKHLLQNAGRVIHFRVLRQKAYLQIGLARSCDLTEMEINVLRLVCEGYEYAEMAERLHISQRTIKYHMGNLLSKTGYSNKIQLAIAATQNSYIVPRFSDEPK